MYAFNKKLKFLSHDVHHYFAPSDPYVVYESHPTTIKGWNWIPSVVFIKPFREMESFVQATDFVAGSFLFLVVIGKGALGTTIVK